MAQQQMSLFGPTPEEVRAARLEQQRQQGEDRFAANIAAFKGDLPGVATGYALGSNVGRGLTQAARGLFGQEIEDPLLEKSILMESITKEFEGLDFNDPGTLQKVAGRLQEAGLYNEAMNVFDRSLAISTKMAELGAKTKKKYNTLSLTDITKIGEIADRTRNAKEYLETWDDEFLIGIPGTAGIREFSVNTFPDLNDEKATAAVNWWKGYQRHKNKVRNTLFGGALTPTEKKEFDKESIDSSIRNSKIIRDVLEREAEYLDNAWRRLTASLKLSGYDPQTVDSLSMQEISEIAGSDTRVQQELKRIIEEEEKGKGTTSQAGPMAGAYKFPDEPGSTVPVFTGDYSDF